MPSVTQHALSVTQWAQWNFGNCQLGDKRRTARLVQLAEQFGSNPSASLPDQTEIWSDLKAAYRLFDRDEVTFEAIARPHWELTRQSASGRCLVIGDTTEIDFGRFREIDGVGPTGNGTGNGFLLHNALLVQADTGETIGVAGQVIHHRKPKRKTKKRENASQRMKRERESQVWGKVIEDIGPPADGVEYVHVFDRGADNFEVYCHLLEQKGEWVIRASKLSRKILAGAADEPMTLQEYLPHLRTLGSYTLSLRARPGQAARESQLKVRVGRIKIPRPRHVSPWVRDRKQPPIAMNVIEVVEVNAPEGITPIRWVLLTSLPVSSLDDAWEIIGYYESRWLVEEYHKALKTGCCTEARQLKTGGRLEALVGLTSVVALRLLQLKSLARIKPEVPAQRVVPAIWLQMLKLARKNLTRVHDLTVGQFYREVAKLGGFLGRKGDGEPGWLTIWRGWEKLNMYVTVASKLKNEPTCG
jgi:hypothetical protein